MSDAELPTHESPRGPANEPATPNRSGRTLVVLAVLALLAGIATGLVGGAFRWCLERAADLRLTALDWAHGLGPSGAFVIAGAVALCAALAVLIVRAVPLATGSGIQVIEAVNRGEAEAPRLNVLPAKFVGSLLALGSGLVLGREGPTVHMGAVLGAEAGRLARRSQADVVTLQTSLAGAGLAVAFNAPIGGALFVFEEVTRAFTLRAVVTVTVGVAAAVATSWLIIGSDPDFTVGPVATPGLELLPVFLIFGLFTGILGTVYNRVVMGFLRVTDRLTRVPPEVKAAIIGAVIGAALFFDPRIVVDGDALSQTLLGGTTLAVPLLVVYLVLRFFAGPLSYAAGTPGGLFAPLLAVGALWGAVFAAIVGWVIPGENLTVPLAIVGMAAFFAATVRAPFTAAVIVLEMTAATSLSVPLIAAAGGAVLMATLLKSAPIYDSLGVRMLASQRRNRA